MANIKIRNLNPGSYAQITSGSFLATALNENEGTQESSTVRATASQIVSGGAVYADFSEELMVSGVPVSTGSTVGGKEVLKPGPGGSIEFGDTNTTINIEGPSIFKESVTINKTLDVTEAATFNSTSLFKGDSTFESNTTFGTDATDTSIFNSTSTFNENSSFIKDVAIGGNLAVGGGLDVGGNLTAGGQKVLALDYSAANNGKVLKIVNGALTWATDDAGLSSVNISNVAGLQTALDGKAASSHTHSWSNITSGKPTTLAGYGITDAASAYTLLPASASILGGIKVGSNLSISNGVLSAPTPTAAYSLPVASASALGGTKEGGDIDIDTNGVMTIKAGSITSNEISNTLNLSGNILNVQRFKVPYVGNKYDTVGFHIEGADSDFDGIANPPWDGTNGINAGIGHGCSAMDGNLTTGKYAIVVYYPGNTSRWYTSSHNLQQRLMYVGNGLVIPHNVAHNSSTATQQPPCHDTSAGYGSVKFINYISGQGQSFCSTFNCNSTWVRLRGDGAVDLHLRSGNAACWTYVVVVALKYE
jgi:hypothetical protein